jgi:hypothetical protein
LLNKILKNANFVKVCSRKAESGKRTCTQNCNKVSARNDWHQPSGNGLEENMEIQKCWLVLPRKRSISFWYKVQVKGCNDQYQSTIEIVVYTNTEQTCTVKLDMGLTSTETKKLDCFK